MVCTNSLLYITYSGLFFLGGKYLIFSGIVGSLTEFSNIL